MRFLKILTKPPFVFLNTMGDFFCAISCITTAYPPLIHPIKTQQILPKSKLFAHLLANVCGLRPRIVRQGCTFGRRLCMETFLFRNFAQTIAPYTFPRSYCRTMQPICYKIALESKLSCYFVANVHYLLYLCNIFAFEREYVFNSKYIS